MSDKALRYNKNKPKWSLVHFKSLEPMIKVLEMGAEKYSPDNWKKGFEGKEVHESMMRHVSKLFDGEWLDEESGLSHIGHIMCNAMFIQYHHDKDEDEQAKLKEGFSKLMKAIKESKEKRDHLSDAINYAMGSAPIVRPSEVETVKQRQGLANKENDWFNVGRDIHEQYY